MLVATSAETVHPQSSVLDPQLESHVTEARFYRTSQMCTLTALAQRNLSHIKLGPFAISPHRVGWLVLVLNLANLGRQNLI